MDASSPFALKEWGAIEQVLAAGESCLLIRKGGLWERRDGFEMEHREFWIFPTLYHQNPIELRPEFGWALDRARLAQPEGDRVRLELFAEVTDAFRVEDPGVLDDLLPHHTLTSATIDARFRYRNRPYLHALILRVHRLPEPFRIANTLGYEGCVSWVELDESLSTAGASAVLDDARFGDLRALLVDMLDGRPGVIRVVPEAGDERPGE